MLQYSNISYATANASYNTTTNSYANANATPPKNIPGSLDIIYILKRQPIPTSNRKFHIFHRQDMYEVYGDESVNLIGDILHLSNNISISHNNTPYLSISLINFITSSKELLNRKWIICLWIFSCTKNSFIPLINASPGNHQCLEEYFIESLENFDVKNNNDTSIISPPPSLSSPNELCFISVRSSNSSGSGSCNSRGSNNREMAISLSFISPTFYEIGYSSFIDLPTFPNLESLLCQLGVKECVTTSAILAANPNLSTVIDRIGLLLSISTCTSSNTIPTSSSFIKVFEAFSSSNIALLNDDISSSLSCLIHYLGLLEDDSNLQKYTLKAFQMQEYLLLDDSAFRGLNILPINDGGGGGDDPSFSLFLLLNHCQTGCGTSLLKEWLRQPLRSKICIESRQHLLQVIHNNSLNLTPILRGLPDIYSLFKRLIRSNRKRGPSSSPSSSSHCLEDLYHLYLSLSKVEPLYNEFSPFKGDSIIMENIITPLKNLSSGLSKFAEMIEEVLDFDSIPRHEFLIRPEYNPSLRECINKKENILLEIEDIFIKESCKLSLERGKKLKLEHSSLYGYHFRTTIKDVQLDPKHYEELSLLKSGLLFRNSKLKELSSLYEEVSLELLSLQKENVHELVEISLGYRNLFYSLCHLLSTLDVLQSFSLSIVQYPSPMVKPIIVEDDDKRILEIVDGRHPLLEGVRGGAGVGGFVQENSLSFSSDKKTFFSITGPNMGGKTTFIRQTALLVLMAQIGMWVPCKMMKVSPFDAILIRVGSGDSLSRGLSTFMVEMLEIASILSISTPKSLVLIDELGRGTGSGDGFGLAWAISKALIGGGNGLKWGNKDHQNDHSRNTSGPFTLFATHFHKIADLEDKFEMAGNLKADVDLILERLTFRIIPGKSDISWGLHVAKLAQFPQKMIDMASQYMMKDDDDEDDKKMLMK